MGTQHIIYMDHSATLFVKPDVANAMIPYFTEHFSNPSSICRIAHESKNLIDAARVQTVTRSPSSPPVAGEYMR